MHAHRRWPRANSLFFPMHTFCFGGRVLTFFFDFWFLNLILNSRQKLKYLMGIQKDHFIIDYTSATLLWNSTLEFLHWTTIYRTYLRTTFVILYDGDVHATRQYSRLTADRPFVLPRMMSSHGWVLIARIIHYRWLRRQRLDWPMHCGESWSQRHTISWLGAAPHTTMIPPVNENRRKVWPHGELNGNWQVWAAMIHPVASRSCTCSLNYESAFLNGRKQQTWENREPYDNEIMVRHFRSCAGAETVKQITERRTVWIVHSSFTLSRTAARMLPHQSR